MAEFVHCIATTGVYFCNFMSHTSTLILTFSAHCGECMPDAKWCMTSNGRGISPEMGNAM